MLTIICGEDNVASRSYMHELVETYRKNNCEILRITTDQLKEIPQELSESLSLFGLKKVYVLENLNRTVRKGSEDKILKRLDSLKETDLIVWEDGISKRELKLQGVGIVKEFKPSESIFKLLDACYPGNLKNFIALYREIASGQNDMFIFIMLIRHIRNLVLVKQNKPPASLQSWQVAKLKGQAGRWEAEKLVDFYDKLIGLELGLKKGANPYTLGQGLEMVSCYYIK